MKRPYLFNTWMQTTSTDGTWFKNYQHMDLNGRKAEDFTPEKIDELVKKGEKGYLLEVDKRYSKQLRESHNELPFLTERMKIGRVEKLVPNLKDKKRYVVDIKAVDQALKHDLKLKKVHRIIEFQQNRWMKAYIKLNTRLRKMQRMSLRRTSLSC